MQNHKKCSITFKLGIKKGEQQQQEKEQKNTRQIQQIENSYKLDRY